LAVCYLSFKTKGKVELHNSHLSHHGILLGLGGKSHGQGPDRGIGEGNKRENQGGLWQELGDAKLESDGKAGQAAGRIQNAVGGVKDTVKGK
jgi:uncharacterized protein YjbJ (UPF0337 family)